MSKYFRKFELPDAEQEKKPCILSFEDGTIDGKKELGPTVWSVLYRMCCLSLRMTTCNFMIVLVRRARITGFARASEQAPCAGRRRSRRECRPWEGGAAAVTTQLRPAARVIPCTEDGPVGRTASLQIGAHPPTHCHTRGNLQHSERVYT